MLLPSVNHDDSCEQGARRYPLIFSVAKSGLVRGVWPSIQHDVSIAINTKRSLCCMRGRSEKDPCNFFSGYRHKGC